MKGNQIKAKMIKSFPKSDGEKLAGLERFLHRKFIGCSTLLEPYLKFTKGENGYEGFNNELSHMEVTQFKIQHPDVLMFLDNEMVILELDGSWHDKHVEQTEARNKIYELNDLKYIVVNETDLKHKLGIAKSALLTQDQINDEFYKKIRD